MAPISEKMPEATGDASWDQFRTFMEGNANEYANAEQTGRYDAGNRGMNTPDVFSVDAPSPAIGIDIAPEPQVATFNQPQSQAQDWQRLYGQSENEKGQWRKTAQDAQAQLDASVAELKALRAALMGGQGGGYTPSPYGQPAQYPIPQAAPQMQYGYASQQQAQGMKLFEDERPKDDFVQVQDLERIVKNVIAPAVLESWGETQKIGYYQQLAQKKASSGITPEVEGRLHNQFPWLAGFPEDEKKLAAMQDLLARTTPRQTPQVANSGRARQGNSQVEAAARRVMAVGPAGVQAGGGQEGLTPDELFQSEMQSAMDKPWGPERKKAFDELFKKNNIGRANDFGPGFVRP